MSPLRAASIDTAWMAGAAGLDLASTRYGLARCPTCREANPLMQSPAVAVVAKVAATAGAGLVCYELRRHGHPRAAKVFRWSVAALWGGVAVHNLAQSR